MIDYHQDGWFGFCGGIWRCTFKAGSVLPGAIAISLLSGATAVALSAISEAMPELWDDTGIAGLKASQLWAAMTASLLFLIGFRTNKAYGRFWDGTTLLHQMWGEWFDAVSCLIAFSSLSMEKQPAKVAQFRHTLVRLMSLCHGSAMEEISPESHQRHICLDVGGLDQKTLKYLTKAKNDKNLGFNRVEVVIHMIQTLVVFNQSNGVLKIPPPILSRVFQTLSRGQVNLANAKKITSTLFPFPYAQLIGVLLIVFSVCTPVAMASIISSKHWVCIFTVVPVLSLFALNYVACQLEMPFGADPNDLPLSQFQDHMNTSLLMLIRPETDLVPHVHEFCATSYDDIKATRDNKPLREYINEDHDDYCSQPSLGAKHCEVSVRPKSQRLLGQEPKDIQGADLNAQASRQITQFGSAQQSQRLAPVKAPVKEVTPSQSQQLGGFGSQKVDKSMRKSQSLDGKLSEPSLQKSMGVLNTKFEELVGHINGLSAQMGKSTDEFRNLMANANLLSYQMDAARHIPPLAVEENSPTSCWCGGLRHDFSKSSEDRHRAPPPPIPFMPPVPREHRWASLRGMQAATMAVSGDRGTLDNI